MNTSKQIRIILMVLITICGLCIQANTKESEQRVDPEPTGPIVYMDPDIGEVPWPYYSGRRYEAVVPATLDIAERAGMALNALTQMLNVKCDFEPFWRLDLLDTPPRMDHNFCDVCCPSKFLQAIPLCRTASGADIGLDKEYGLMRRLLKMQGEDGLIYSPLSGRPWATLKAPMPGAGIYSVPEENQLAILTWVNGRALGAFSIYALVDPEGPWREAAKKLAGGLKRATILDGDVAYLCQPTVEPGWEPVKPENPPKKYLAMTMAQAAHGLAQYHRLLGEDPEAAELARKMIRYILRDAEFFGPDGEFMPGHDDQPSTHYHSHSLVFLAALEIAHMDYDRQLIDLSLEAYEYGANRYGERLIGFFPVWVNEEPTEWHKKVFNGVYGSETCPMADMVMSGIYLSKLGIDRWEDVDRWVRNQYSESQVTWTEWCAQLEREEPMITQYYTTENVPERALGAFAGWPMPNDFNHPYMAQSIQNCCTVNGAKALYVIWREMQDYENGKLSLHLLLNRASQWADVDSHLPYKGRVEVKIKRRLNLEARIPEWVELEAVECKVNGKVRPVSFKGRYAQIGKVRKGQEVVLTFPMTERTDTVTVQGTDYQLIRRGNTVVSIDPQGAYCPIHKRGHYRGNDTLWKKVTRFVPDDELNW